MAIDADKPVSILLHGEPGTAKTQFVKSVKDMFPNVTEYIIGSDTTKAGLNDLLFAKAKTIKYLVIDEIEYLPKKDQAILLNLMETGILRETKRTMMRETKINVTIFATCNNIDKLSEPLQTRFLCKYLKRYDYADFEQITIGRLMNEYKKMKPEFAAMIANAVWSKKAEDSNVRDCVRVALMAKTEEEIDFMVEEI